MKIFFFSLSLRSEGMKSSLQGTRKSTQAFHIQGATQLAEVWRKAFQVTRRMFSNQCEGNCGSSGAPNTNQHLSMAWKSVSELIAGYWWKDYFLHGGKENKNPAQQLYAKMTKTLKIQQPVWLPGWLDESDVRKKKRGGGGRGQKSKQQITTTKTKKPSKTNQTQTKPTTNQQQQKPTKNPHQPVKQKNFSF